MVQSVTRAFAVLQALATGPAGVSEIAERTDLPKSTVSRLLSTLTEVGAVEQTEAQAAYRLGELLIDLSTAANPGNSLVGAARPILTELVDELGEVAGVSVLDGPQVYYLDQVQAADQDVQVRDWTGETLDPHVTSSGLVLLAHATDSIVEAALAESLEAHTEQSVVDPDEIRRRLADAKRSGFVWVHEEMADGLSSIAAPVVNPAGTVVAAVHVHGPTFRFPEPGTAAAIAASVVDAASRLSDRLSGEHHPSAA